MGRVVFFMVLVLSGCMKPVTPAPTPQASPKAVQKPPFAVDGLPPPLTAGCIAGADANGAACARLDLLEDGQKTLERLHRQQSVEISAALQQVYGILNRPADKPAVRLSANPLDTNEWIDPLGSYPAILVLRVEYKRGLAYLQGVDAVQELKSALHQLDRTAELHRIQWRKQRNEFPRSMVIPEEIVRERQPIDVRVNFVDETRKLTLPAPLARQYLARETEPWDTVVAHVSNKKILHTHRHQLAVPLTITTGARIEITETDRRLDRVEFVSDVTPQEACGLVGELRFVPRDSTPPMRAKPQGVARSGGLR